MTHPIVQHELRSDIVYVPCNTYLHKFKTVCENKLPLDSKGKFSGVCGVCKSHTEHSYWWLSVKQRDFQCAKEIVRSDIKKGRAITLEVFDMFCKEFL
jgi:hypothetical protein